MLDVGCGVHPTKEATHCLDIGCKKLRCDKVEDEGAGPFDSNVDKRPFTISYAQALPFKDKTFDYVYCNQVMEHTLNPLKACKEIQRVGKAGWIESPPALAEQGTQWYAGTRGWRFHKWYVWVFQGKLYFKKIKDPIKEDFCDCRFAHFINTLFEECTKKNPYYFQHTVCHVSPFRMDNAIILER